MRILFLTNFYPPHELGGQGRSCQRAVEGLRQRGHTTAVITSMHGTSNQPRREGEVHRCLYLEMDFTPWRNSVTFFTHRRQRERENLQRLERLLAEFAPELVFVWGMWNLPRSLASRLEALAPGRVVYRFAEYWPTLPSQYELYWREPARSWRSQLPKRLLRPLALAMLAREERPTLEFEHTFCVSAATRYELIKAGVPVADARIIHTGLDVAPFIAAQAPPPADGTLRLLYAGRLASTKGVDVLLEALARVLSMPDAPRVHLTVAGAGDAPYERHLQLLALSLSLSPHVTFLGRVPEKQMPALFHRHDVLIAPSVWAEPFARVILEGMAAGLVVVATRVGGNGEILADGQNGLLCEPYDVSELAQKIADLAADPARRRRLSAAGRETVLASFTERRWLDQIEAYLQEVAVAPSSPPEPIVWEGKGLGNLSYC